MAVTSGFSLPLHFKLPVIYQGMLLIAMFTSHQQPYRILTICKFFPLILLGFQVMQSHLFYIYDNFTS